MPEVIQNYVAPIATIPIQSLLAGQIAETRKAIGRSRKKETIDQLTKKLSGQEAELSKVLKSLGR